MVRDAGVILVTVVLAVIGFIAVAFLVLTEPVPAIDQQAPIPCPTDLEGPTLCMSS